MAVSSAFLEACYYTLIARGNCEYRGYSLKWSTKNKEFLILRNKRKLASWFVDTDELKTYQNGNNPAELSMTKQFLLLFPLNQNARKLTELPVRELTNIMSVSRKRKRMPPHRVNLREQVHRKHPLTKRMIIVSKYELVEKSAGVFS